MKRLDGHVFTPTNTWLIKSNGQIVGKAMYNFPQGGSDQEEVPEVDRPPPKKRKKLEQLAPA